MTLPCITQHVDRYKGASAFVVGTGTSLKNLNWSLIDAQRLTIALNNAVFLFTPTYHLWFDENISERYVKLSHGEKTTPVVKREIYPQLMQTSYIHRVLTYRGRGPDVARTDDSLWCDYTVATAGIQLAWLLGAKTIYLLGIDGYEFGNARYCTDTITERDKTKYTVQPWHAFYNSDMWKLRQEFEKAHKKGDRVPVVINLNPRSTISAWPKIEMQRVFVCLKQKET